MATGLNKSPQWDILEATGRVLPLVAKDATVPKHYHSFLVLLKAVILASMQQQLVDSRLAFECQVASSVAAVFLHLVQISTLSSLKCAIIDTHALVPIAVKKIRLGTCLYNSFIALE
jgi:hypothetical protein